MGRWGPTPICNRHQRAGMTMAACARRHGVSKVCVSKWVKRGVITLTPDGVVDVHRSDERLAGGPRRQKPLQIPGMVAPKFSVWPFA
jgi:hypothetical protein